MEQSAIEGRVALERRYLDLLKLSLTRQLSADSFAIVRPAGRNWARLAFGPLRGLLARRGYQVVRRVSVGARREGRDWPVDAETMVGSERLDNLENCIRDVIRDGIQGDLIECGTWRGGAAIFMRAALEVLGDEKRRVWVADSFRGLPKPDLSKYPEDAGDLLHSRKQLAIELEEVRRNFERYGFLDSRVRFLVGWFDQTLPQAPIESLAVLRLDADMYKGTIEALEALYPKVSLGGFVVVDDYGAMASCRKAVEDFRDRNDIREPIESIDWTGVYWRRGK